MPKIIEIAGTDRTDLVRDITVRIKRTMQQSRSGKLTLTVADPRNSFRPSVGEKIELFNENENSIIGGTIQDIDVEPKDVNLQNEYKIDLVTNEAIADQRTITWSWANTAADQIVKDAISRVLTEENVTEGTIQSADVIPQYSIRGGYVSRLLNDISEMVGFHWRINADRTLDFVRRNDFTAPFPLTESNHDKFQNLKDISKVELGKYRNREMVLVKDGVLKSRTQTFNITQKTKDLDLEFEIESLSSIKVNGVEESNKRVTFIQGSEFDGFDTSQKKWTYTPGTKKLSLVFAASPLEDGDTVKVTYQGRGSAMIVAQDDDAIDARAAVEPGSGIHTHVSDQEFNDQEIAEEFAKGQVRRYGTLGIKIQYETTELGLAVGQTHENNDLPDHDITEDMIIEEIKIEARGAADGTLFRTVKATNREPDGATFQQRQTKDGRGADPRDDDLLVLPKGVTHSADSETGKSQAQGSDEDSELEVSGTGGAAPTASNDQIWVVGTKKDENDPRMHLVGPGGVVSSFTPSDPSSNDDVLQVCAVVTVPASGNEELINFGSDSDLNKLRYRRFTNTADPDFIGAGDISGSNSFGYNFGATGMGKDGTIWVGEWNGNGTPITLDNIDPSSWSISQACQVDPSGDTWFGVMWGQAEWYLMNYFFGGANINPSTYGCSTGSSVWDDVTSNTGNDVCGVRVQNGNLFVDTGGAGDPIYVPWQSNNGFDDGQTVGMGDWNSACPAVEF